MNKRAIDNVWMKTEIGRWIRLASEGKIEEANELHKKIEANAPMMQFCFELKNVCEDIAKCFKDEDEFMEYLKALDAENHNIAEFIVSSGSFDDVFIALGHDAKYFY